MNILFIHQNFPGQFKYLAKKLALNKNNRVIALRGHKNTLIEGVESYEYPIINAETVNGHPLIKDFETKIRRAESVAKIAITLRNSGFNPDVVVMHPGWGEGLFLRDVWTKTKIIAYLEYYYHFEGQDVNFDPEFPLLKEQDRYCIRLKNQATLNALNDADAFITPTKWQYQQFPKWRHKSIKLIHDGIDMAQCIARPNAQITLERAGITLTRKDQVVTYVSRGLEPLRGFHQFMRALPKIIQQQPNVHILIVGRDIPAYENQKFINYKEQLLEELSPQLDSKHIYFLGNVAYTDYVQILQLSSAHIYLTYPFIASWSLLEAMAIECPIIGSNTAPVSEFIQHNQNGLLVDFFSPEQLAQAVSRVLSDQTLSQRLGRNARKTIQSRYHLNDCLKKQLHLIQRVTSNK